MAKEKRKVTAVAIQPELIESSIYLIRGQKVMLSMHLAELYEVEPRMLIQAVKRKVNRFPSDFIFRLTKDEFASLRSQLVILDKGRGRYPKYPPYAFTEHGVAMLSTELNSERAVHVNINIMRAFVRLRQLIVSNESLGRKIAAYTVTADFGERFAFHRISRSRGRRRSLCHPPRARFFLSTPRRCSLPDR